MEEWLPNLCNLFAFKVVTYHGPLFEIMVINNVCNTHVVFDGKTKRFSFLFIKVKVLSHTLMMLMMLMSFDCFTYNNISH